jgi:hypothetical protein
MVPLVFILIVSLVLILLVYWVISTMKFDDDQDTEAGSFFFETAPELYTYGYLPDIQPYIPYQTNQIRLCRGNSSHLLTYWMVEEDKKAEFMKDSSINGELGLRIYQTSAGVKYDDVAIRNLKGSYHFSSKPDTAYYTVLGIKDHDTFIPWIYSNTILSSEPSSSKEVH